MPSAPSDNPLPYNPVPLGGSAAGAQFTAGGQNPTGTASLVNPGPMMGLGWVFTPQASGRVSISVNGQISNNTAADGAACQLRWGFGTPPVNGAAAVGTQILGTSALLTGNANTAAAGFPFALDGLLTGMTPGVPFWVDISLRALTGGTATISNVLPSFYEF
jgi:hypothetical protein